jgi:hypothetical protein
MIAAVVLKISESVIILVMSIPILLIFYVIKYAETVL